MTIEDVRKLSHNSDKVFITQHAAIRLRERHIKYNDIISAIQTGEIIENYPTDFPYPSCLILGLTLNQNHIHVVCGTDNEYLWVITAYYPSEKNWYKDMKTRKE